MKTSRTALPVLVALSALGLSACQDQVSAPATTTVTAPSSQEQSSGSESPSQSSEESSASESSTSDSPSSDSSTSDPSSATSESSASSGSGGQKVTASDLAAFAKTHETRACKVSDLSYILGGAQFCETDTDDITADYSGQRVYITTAVTADSGASYSYTATNGARSQSQTFDSSSLKSGSDGGPVSLAVTLPMESSGTYKVTFKKNGTAFTTKDVKVSVN